MIKSLFTVVLSLDTEVVLEIAAPSITTAVRTNFDLAVVTFKPLPGASGQEFVVSYYTVANSSGTPDLVSICIQVVQCTASNAHSDKPPSLR